MKSKLPVIIVDDVEEQLTYYFQTNELLDITQIFINSVGKQAPIDFNYIDMTAKDIVSENLDVLTDKEKIDFFKQIKEHSQIKNNNTNEEMTNHLRDEIDFIVNYAKTPKMIYKKQLPVVLLEDVTRQLSYIFSNDGILDLTVIFMENIGKKAEYITYSDVPFDMSIQEAVDSNLNLLSDSEKLSFVYQIQYHHLVYISDEQHGNDLQEQIKNLINRTVGEKEDRIDKRNNISFVEFDNIENQLKEIFTGNEIITLTRIYAESISKDVPIKKVNFHSKKEIIAENLGILSENERIEFLRQLKKHSKVLQNQELCDQIDKIVSGTSGSIIKSRNSITVLLSNYPNEITEQWKKSYVFYDQSDYRNALDNIRLTLELLVKFITKSDKSLENQQKDLGSFLKEKGISSSFRNLFFKMLDMYLKIQNNNSKHNLPTNLSYEEITFLLNQSSLIIRFLVDCDKKKD